MRDELKPDAKSGIELSWRLVIPKSPWPFEPEFEFCAGRRWRFDWASQKLKLAIEIEGIVYGGKGGRHQRAGGLEGDCEKYNAAIALGWRVLRFTPDMVNRDPAGCVDMILRAADQCDLG